MTIAIAVTEILTGLVGGLLMLTFLIFMITEMGYKLAEFFAFSVGFLCTAVLFEQCAYAIGLR